MKCINLYLPLCIRPFLGIFPFLVATKRLYKRVCPSVSPSVRRLVTLSLFGLLGATGGRVSGLVLFGF